MVYLERQFADSMIAHARAEIPNECCGILAGAKGKVTRLYRAINAERSPFRYTIDPNDQLHIYKEIEKNGWDFLGIYHSHTHTEAYPSAVDIKIALWSDSIYFIISLMDMDKPVIRAFKIADGQVSEELMEIT